MLAGAADQPEEIAAATVRQAVNEYAAEVRRAQSVRVEAQRAKREAAERLVDLPVRRVRDQALRPGSARGPAARRAMNRGHRF